MHIPNTPRPRACGIVSCGSSSSSSAALSCCGASDAGTGPADGAGFSSSPAMICAIESCAVREMFAMRAASAARALSLARSSLKTRPDGSAASSAGDVPGLLGRVGNGCVCRGGFGGASAAGISSTAGASAVGSGSVTAGSGPFRRLAAPKVLGTSGTVVRQRPPGRGLRRFGLAFRPRLGKLRRGGNGALLCGGLALRGLVSRGFFRRLSSLRRLGLCGFCCLCCLCVFFWPAAWGTRQVFLCSARLRQAARRCPSAQGRVGGRLGLAALRRRGFGLGPPPAVPQWISFYLLPYSHSLFRDLYGCPAKRQRHGRPGVPCAAIFYSARGIADHCFRPARSAGRWICCRCAAHRSGCGSVPAVPSGSPADTLCPRSTPTVSSPYR